VNCLPSCTDWNQTVGPWGKLQPSPMSSADGAKEHDPGEGSPMRQRDDCHVFIALSLVEVGGKAAHSVWLPASIR